MDFLWSRKGLLAISAPLTGYKEFIDIYTDKKSTDVRLIKSMITNNYQDYVKYFHSRDSTDMTDNFVKILNEVEINIKLH